MLERIPGNKEIIKVSRINRVKGKVIMLDMIKNKAEVHSMLVVTDSRGSSLWLPTDMLCQVMVSQGGQMCSGAAVSRTHLYYKLQFYRAWSWYN